MFILAFAISMFVAFLIYGIKKILTSVYINSFFDEEAKKEVLEAKRIQTLQKREIKKIMKELQQEMHDDLNDFYHGINKDKGN